VVEAAAAAAPPRRRRRDGPAEERPVDAIGLAEIDAPQRGV